jgi:hypothetical protein
VLDPQLSNSSTQATYGYSGYWLGLGLMANEAALWSSTSDDGPSYPTFVQTLVNNGVINSNTYSVWMDTKEGETGTGHLLLGGINSKRYQGSLVTLPTSIATLHSPYTFLEQTQLTVKLSSIKITTGSGTTEISVPVDNAPVSLLHEAYWTSLNPEAAVAIWDAVGAVYNKDVDPFYAIPTVPCSFLSNSSTLDFELEGITFKVPMSSLVWHNGTGPLFDQGPWSTGCAFLIGAEYKGVHSTFSALALRQLYTVYDLSNNEISVALTDFDSQEDDIIEIPSAGIASIGCPVASDGNNCKKKPTKAIAIGLGVGIPVFLIICIALYLLFRKRRGTKKGEAAVTVTDQGDTIHHNELAASELKGDATSGQAVREDIVQPYYSPPIREDHEVYASEPWRAELSNDRQGARGELSSPDSAYGRNEMPAGHNSSRHELPGY